MFSHLYVCTYTCIFASNVAVWSDVAVHICERYRYIYIYTYICTYESGVAVSGPLYVYASNVAESSLYRQEMPLLIFIRMIIQAMPLCTHANDVHLHERCRCTLIRIRERCRCTSIYKRGSCLYTSGLYELYTYRGAMSLYTYTSVSAVHLERCRCTLIRAMSLFMQAAPLQSEQRIRLIQTADSLHSSIRFASFTTILDSEF